MCVGWFIILFYCIIKDGEMIESGFARIVAITGAVVNIAYMLGNYLKDIASIKYKDLEVTINKEKKHELDSK